MLKKIKKLWLMRRFWRLYFSKVFDFFISFAKKHYPFKVYFITLECFERDEVYKRNIAAQKMKTPWLTRGIVEEVRERSWKEYDEGLEKIELLANEKTENEELLKRVMEINLDVLEKLLKFLVAKEVISPKEAIHCCKKLEASLDPKSEYNSCQNVVDYVKSVIEKYREHLQ